MIPSDLAQFARDPTALGDSKTYTKVQEYLGGLDPVHTIFEAKRLHSLAKDFIASTSIMHKRPYIFMIKVTTRRWIEEHYERI